MDYRQLFLISQDAILIVDMTDGRILDANPAVRWVLGYEPETLAGRPFSALFPDARHLSSHDYLETLRVYDSTLLQDFRCADGTRATLELTLTVMPHEDRHLAFVSLRRGAERLAEEEVLRSLANRDPLTNVFNRRFFLERTDAALRLSLERSLPLALAVCDLDEFKALNDRWGHLAGDRVLVKIGQIVSSELRQGDMVARFGGDEWAILLHRMWARQAVAVLERVRLRVASERDWNEDGSPIAVSISCGVADNGGCPAASAEQLFEHADQALLAVKRSGKGGIGVYSPSSSTVVPAGRLP